MNTRTRVQLVEAQAFTIAYFCLRNGISLTTYHKLKNEGRGPREMCLGSAIRISIEAERDWRSEREKPLDAEARLIACEAEARVKASKKAGALSAASPKHVSKTKRKA
jgi:hypothetical protein